MRRRENLAEQKGVTVYMTEYEWNQRRKKNSSSGSSSKNSTSADPQWWNSQYVPEKPYNDDYGFMNT